VTQVRQSYVIWYCPRVGSTLLAQTLEDLGIAGRPREWFEPAGVTGLLASGHELREAFWREATTSNGVLGIKYGMIAKRHAELVALLGDWDAAFPNCKHVFLTRRDRVRLAVSWWRAIQSGEWHRPDREALTAFDGPAGRAPRVMPPPDLVDRYDRNAIEHLIAEASEREADIQTHLAASGVVPYTIVYEDMIASYEATVRALLEFLAVPGREAVTDIPAPAYAPLADAVTEAWCERFHRG